MENFINESISILASIDTSKVYTMDQIKRSGNIGFMISHEIVKALSFGECVLSTKRVKDKQVNMVYLVGKERYLHLFTVINNYPAESTVLLRVHNNSTTLREVIAVLDEIVEDRDCKYIYSNNKNELFFSSLVMYPKEIGEFVRLDKQPVNKADMSLEEFKKHCSDPELMSHNFKENSKYTFGKHLEKGQESGLFEKVVVGSADHILEANSLPTKFTLKRYRGPVKDIEIIDVLRKGDDTLLRYLYYYTDSYKYLCILNIGDLRLYGPADSYMGSIHNVIVPEGYTVHDSYKSGVIYKLD